MLCPFFIVFRRNPPATPVPCFDRWNVFSTGISLLAMLWPVEDWALQTFTAPTDSGNASGDASGGVDAVRMLELLQHLWR